MFHETSYPYNLPSLPPPHTLLQSYPAASMPAIPIHRYFPMLASPCKGIFPMLATA